MSESSRRRRRLLDKGGTSTYVPLPQQENGFIRKWEVCVQRHVYELNACGYKNKGLVVLGLTILFASQPCVRASCVLLTH